ncbi:hypothetical protein GF362_00175 [Candidatus Dojkabacteria bacterium]|nr:hypothetical protein [Candidatus Dojkabacteria bacterium]
MNNFEWMKENKLIIKVLLFLVLIFIDRLTKYIIISYSDIAYSSNSGFAFGLLEGFEFALIINLIALICMGIVAIKDSFSMELIFLLAGATSNFFDRVYLGGIIDFIKILSFPWFNFADMFINIGIILYILRILLPDIKKFISKH